MKIDNEKIDLILATQNVSAKELAVKMGVSWGSLYSMRYKTESIRPKTVHKLADALRVKVEDIIV